MLYAVSSVCIHSLLIHINYGSQPDESIEASVNLDHEYLEHPGLVDRIEEWPRICGERERQG